MEKIALKRQAHETIAALKAELSKALPVSDDHLNRLVYAVLCRNDGVVLLGGFGESMTISFLNLALAKTFQYGSHHAIFGDSMLSLDQFLAGVECEVPCPAGTDMSATEMRNFCAITNVTGANLRSLHAILQVVQPGTIAPEDMDSVVLLPEPFFLTLHEQDGDFSMLPEGVKDRAELQLHLPEISVTDLSLGIRQIEPVANIYELVTLRHYLASGIEISDAARNYAIRLVRSGCEDAEAGFSLRAVQSLVRLARVEAAANERDLVSCEDVQAVAPAALAHRVVLNRGAGIDQDGAVIKLLESVPVAA